MSSINELENEEKIHDLFPFTSNLKTKDSTFEPSRTIRHTEKIVSKRILSQNSKTIHHYGTFDGRSDNLTAGRILAHELQSTHRFYLIKWVGVSNPTWIKKIMCPEQTRTMIEHYCAHAIKTGKMRPSKSGSKKFYVESIVSDRVIIGRKEYFIKWDGFPDSDNTWESAEKLAVDIPKLVQEYEAKSATMKAMKRQESN